MVNGAGVASGDHFPNGGILPRVGCLRVFLTDTKGNVTRRNYDGLNRLIATTRQLTDTGDGLGSVIGSITTSQNWDDDSRLTAQIDDNGNATAYIYDPLNRLAATVCADSTGQTNYYDVHDNAVLSFDANGTAVINSYDLLNRLVRRDVNVGTGVSPATTFESFSYDGLSRLVKAQNDASLITRSYDSLSHLTVEVENSLTNRCRYDGVGNELECQYPGGRLITNSFDELERKRGISGDAHSVWLCFTPGAGFQRRYTLRRNVSTLPGRT